MNENEDNLKIDKNKQFEEEYAEIGMPSGVEKDYEITEEFPFDAEKISISTMPVPLTRLKERIESGTISSPEIQRRDNLWDESKQSRLMESLMLRIPLPLFYVAADQDENWKIIDGLQRVSAIKNFMIGNANKGKYQLNNLEFLKDFDGKFIDELPTKYQNRIKDTQLQFAVVSATTPPEVQRNIFKRLNTGGLPLTLQEIRHALYYEQKSSDFIKGLSDSEAFKKATDKSINDSRMVAQELVLRFIAFLIRDTSSYLRDDSMDSFISETMILLNLMPGFDKKQMQKHFPNKTLKDLKLRYFKYEEIKEKFYMAMERAEKLFDSYAFRKSMPNDRRTPINKALFETISVILAEISQEKFDALYLQKETVYSAIKDKFESHNFETYVSRDSQKSNSVKKRFEILKEIFQCGDNGK